MTEIVTADDGYPRFGRQRSSLEQCRDRLAHEPWWEEFRRARSSVHRLTDAICLGRFVVWLDERELTVGTCGAEALVEYLATLSRFRPAMQTAHRSRLLALYEQLESAGSAAPGAQGLLEATTAACAVVDVEAHSRTHGYPRATTA